jgi:hypothetical protein
MGGSTKVRVEVNKGTDPYAYDVVFEEQQGGKTALVVAPGKFIWNFQSYRATLNGKPCREISYDEPPGNVDYNAPPFPIPPMEPGVPVPYVK